MCHKSTDVKIKEKENDKKTSRTAAPWSNRTSKEQDIALLHVYFNYLKFALGKYNKKEAKSKNRLQAKPMAARFTNFQKWFGQQKLT